MGSLEPADPGGQLVAAIELGNARELLGGAVDRVDVIVAIVEEVAYLLPGHRGQATGGAVERLVQAGEALLALTIGTVQGQNRMRHPRRVGCDDLQFGAAVRGGVEHRVGQRLAQVGHQPVALVHREH